MSKRKRLSTEGNYNFINHRETSEKQSNAVDNNSLSLSKYTVVGIGHNMIIPRS